MSLAPSRRGFRSRLFGRLAIVAGALLAVAALPSAVLHAAEDGPRRISPEAKPVEHDKKVFRSDPDYGERGYEADRQIEIYGGKRALDAPRPVLEIGRPIYREGPFRRPINVIGKKNLVEPSLSVFGDWRTALAYNDNGAVETGQVATRLNLDVDLRLTATERLHAFFRPLDGRGQFTRHEFFGDDRDQGDLVIDGNLETLFFEGDVGAIYSGLADDYTSWDLPFAVGLTPLLFQNGVWLEDAFIGGAVSLTALNSPRLDISNMDFTVFGGFDKVTTPAILDDQGALADHNLDIFGVAAFVEANEGYWEAGYGRIEGSGDFDDNGYDSLTVAFTRRYGGWLSNSVRGIWTFGQDPDDNAQQTADGVILLVENSLITSRPTTLVPYLNAWIGLDRPQPLADDTGLLKNTGINFETDALTGFPKLDDTGQDTFGAALGIEYLFGLDQQIVVELAALNVFGDADDLGRPAKDDQYALGLRYQLPVTNAWIVRADAMHGWRRNDDDIRGVRFEVRRKF